MGEPAITDLLKDLERLAKQIEERKSELASGSTTDFIRHFASISKSLQSVSIAEKSMEEKARHLLNNRETTIHNLRREHLRLLT